MKDDSVIIVALVHLITTIGFALLLNFASPYFIHFLSLFFGESIFTLANDIGGLVFVCVLLIFYFIIVILHILIADTAENKQTVIN